eukprot:TRINITY_DN2601_c0_g2_i2.p1 TRINITY_DN2601_c0_g2~~TRINITY_DN2601_c0_g2_i2.p1  ORF type:complete len:570 (-),score=114.20 TRINITY_DN2601_c0_g2_i2:22-1731(-)
MERYKELQILSRGQHSRVHKVVESSTGKEYAMKVIDLKRSSFKKFCSEVKGLESAVSLSHPNIVSYASVSANHADAEFTIIMEYCHGSTLRDLIEEYKKEEKTLPESMLMRCIVQILSGINYLHKCNVVHKNLKPENILIDAKGDLRITDYKLPYKLMGKRDVGGLKYLSVKVLKGRGCDFVDDIWALGCIFYELCALKPFCDELIVPRFLKVLAKKPYNYSAVRNKSMKGIIAQMLNPDAKQRPSCEELLSNPTLSAYSSSCRQVKSSRRGERYEGELKRGCFHGRGALCYADGSKYDGEWKDNKKSGKGIFYYTSGEKYEGDWEEDKRSGKGVLYSSTRIYDGCWKNDKKCGKGTLICTNGDKYEGEWEDDRINGKGIYCYQSESECCDRKEMNYSVMVNGEWVKGNLCNEAHVHYSNGNRYEGKFENNNLNGEGTFHYADGSAYEGSFKNNLYHGEGKFSSPKGNYTGSWKEGRRNGTGVQTYANGSHYSGGWKNGKRHGKGELVCANGEKYDGEWRNDRKHGRGVHVTQSSKYDGEWRNDKKLSLIHICRCRRIERCRSRWSPYH